MSKVENQTLMRAAILQMFFMSRLIFSTKNSVALLKHGNSYGEYFLYDSFGEAPVYQHFAGVEYLYRRDGNWLISDEVNSLCP